MVSRIEDVNTLPYGFPVTTRLTRDDWITEGLRVLSERGIESVRVERLARDLGVTKGSFYWHFRDREELLMAMLRRWRSEATDAIIERVEARESEPEPRLRYLLQLCTSGRGDRLESQIRAWGMSSPDVQANLKEVDEVRQAYVARLLREMGISRAEANRRARSVYLALIGEFTWVAHGGPSTAKAVWTSLLELVIAPDMPAPR